MDDKEGIRLQLRDDDEEGKIIQEVGPDSIVYGADLWLDVPALLGLMREDNLNAEIQRGETEIDSLGHVCQLLDDLIDSCGTEGKTISMDDVMQSVADIGVREHVKHRLEAACKFPTGLVEATLRHVV